MMAFMKHPNAGRPGILYHQAVEKRDGNVQSVWQIV